MEPTKNTIEQEIRRIEKIQAKTPADEMHYSERLGWIPVREMQGMILMDLLEQLEARG